jgi:dTDP-4-dehydrorhamnose 3,5-epimerase
MRVTPTELPEVLIVDPRVHGDARGFFLETYHEARYAAAGIGGPFVQDNHSRSAPRVLRGLHFQVTRPQGKLVRCVRGAVFDVAVDIRRGSPRFGRWVAVELTEENTRQLWIPPGFAHGFCVTGGESEVEYKCTGYYEPQDESGIIWNDQTIGIIWPLRDPVLSAKDAAFGEIAPSRLDLPEFR